MGPLFPPRHSGWGRLVGRGAPLSRSHGSVALASSSSLPVIRQPLAYASTRRLREGGWPLSWVLQGAAGAPRGLHNSASSAAADGGREGAPSCSSFRDALPTSALARLAEGAPLDSATPTETGWVPPGLGSPVEAGGPPGVSGELFESPLCLQIDQLIYSCEQPEEILRLLVSHRAALYVHNLVTALKALAELAIKGPPSVAPLSGAPSPAAGAHVQPQHHVQQPEQQQQQQQREQQEEAEGEIDGGGPLSPSAALLGARMRGPQPPTWPKDGGSFLSFFSLLSGPEAQAERRHSKRSPAQDLVRDDRYHLLLQDLRQHRRLLTFQAAADVALSLRALNHPHYPLLSALLPALTRGPLPPLPEAGVPTDGCPPPKGGAPPEVLSEVLRMRRQQHLLLSVADVYRWAGYTRLPFFDRVARILRDACEEGPPSLPPFHPHHEGIEGAPSLDESGPPILPRCISAADVMRCSPSLLAHSLRSLSRVSLSDGKAFGALCLQGALGASLASAGDLTTMAIAAGTRAPYTPETEKLLTCVVEEICMRPGAFSLTQLAQCLSACTSSHLHFPPLISLLCQRATPHLTLATRTRQRASLTPDALCCLLKNVYYFDPSPSNPSGGPPGWGGPKGPSGGPLEKPPEAASSLLEMDIQEGASEGGLLQSYREALLDVTVRYLEEAIDAISPQAAADAVFAIAAAEGAPERYGYLLSFLFRKIGKDTSWEKKKEEIFSLFLSHKVLFPWLPHELPSRCIMEGLRAWCIKRGGYGVPYPEEAAEVSEMLSNLGVLHESFVQMEEGPYQVDLVLTAADGSKTAMLITDDCSRNSGALSGEGLLVSVHLKHLGITRVCAIPRRSWIIAKNVQEKKRIILTRLDALGGLRAS